MNPLNCAATQYYVGETFACLNGATTSILNAKLGTSTAFITVIRDILVEGTFAFFRYILPYAIVIGLLMVGLAIAWRVYRAVGKV